MKLTRLICLLLLTAFMVTMSAPGVAADGETLTICGDGVDSELIYSREQLESLTDVFEEHWYSSANNFPTEKSEYARGIPLAYLLEQAGIKDTATLITCTASDGYKRDFTVSELLEQPRYYFPASGEKTAVPAMVCLESGENGQPSLTSSELKLTMGQRSHGEQTNPWFVKKLSLIEVSTGQPEKWPEVTFNRVSGPEGVSLELLHENINSVKIYYTTDGSVPTVDSNMYNKSATYYQPELNKTLLITKTATVRAIAIGAGKEDSAVTSITIAIDGISFNDLNGYEWATPAIETLAAEGIVNGVGGGRFSPSGNLTRAMFVTMLGRALNNGEIAADPAPGNSFPDVDYSSWYGPHVNWAVVEGIVTGYPDGSFKPSKPVTVEEMLTMAVRAAHIDPSTQTGDSRLILDGITEWARPFVIAAELNGILEIGHIAAETPDGLKLTGTDRASRAEAAVTVYRLD